ncbi:hypothetical protein WJX72_000358 [[Myrmecia] bisecta]|uniref:thiamine diphosphokinase n=1 Tax=[Myrmecia] bisecta TaxID=41462 RepID=A0AAW1PN42_9CHLO
MIRIVSGATTFFAGTVRSLPVLLSRPRAATSTLVMSGERQESSAGSSSSRYILSSDYLAPGKTGSHLVVIVLNYRLPRNTVTLLDKADLQVCADGGANRLYDQLPSLVQLAASDAASPQTKVAQPIADCRQDPLHSTAQHGVSGSTAQTHDAAPTAPNGGVCPSLSPEQQPGTDLAAQLRQRYVPQAIIGDLDSLRPDVREFYEGLGTQTMDLSDDQDSTDLQKCLAYVQQHIAVAPADLADCQIVAVGALGGRLDHTMHNLNLLYKHPQLDLILLGDGSSARLVPKGQSEIRPCRAVEGPSCGLVPLGAPATVTTTGLRWNLDETVMAIKGLVSTSNLIVADTVHVHTNAELIWTTELHSPRAAHAAEAGHASSDEPPEHGASQRK